VARHAARARCRLPSSAGGAVLGIGARCLSETTTISFSPARELTRVATPSTEHEWLEVARGRTVREVEQLVSGHRPGSVAKAECDGQHIRHVDAHVGATPVRASQTISPAIRRAVDYRDGGKCRVPGCRHAVFTDVHHLTVRSEYGKHHPDNLVTLCAAHHDRVHKGKLLVTGSASSVLHFTHADGTPYGGAVAAVVADARAKAFQALTGLGYREGESERALAKIPTGVVPLKDLICQALRVLTPQ
jgi:hypothetical protein